MQSPRPNLTMLLFGCCLLAIGLTVTIGSWVSYDRDTRIVESGERVEAVVSSKQMLGQSNKNSNYIIQYKFNSHRGEVVEVERTVPPRIWKSVRVGGKIPVHYLAADPQQNFPVGSERFTSVWLAICLSILGAIPSAIGGFAILNEVKPHQQDA